MSFQVYLTDGINTAEMDTEDIDVSTTFSITDLQDISNRKDKIQSITFKGTKINNHVFGSYFDLGRSTDFSIGNNLYFNYNPLKSITCLVYEDSELIFKGSLRLSGISIDKNGNVVYDTVLTGSIIDLKTVLQDKYLHDLDFSDLKHRYKIENIRRSWSIDTERFDSLTVSYTNEPFQFGSGYVYPNIDYGYSITGSTGTTLINSINILNFKPAVYVQEYMNRIFEQSELSGYTYEIKGDDEFVTMWKHLVVPDSKEGNTMSVNGFVTTYSMSALTAYTPSVIVNDNYTRLLPVNVIVHPPTGILNSKFLDIYSTTNDILDVKRNFKSGGKVNVNLITKNKIYISPFPEQIECELRLVKRIKETNDDPLSGWATVASQKFIMDSSVSTVTHNIGIDFESSFNVGEQVGIQVYVPRLQMNNPIPPNAPYRYISYTATTVQVSIPGSADKYISTEIVSDSVNPDLITPVAPVNIKQIDFIKSLMNQFNLYCYPSSFNSKHLIFERYDDYYVYFQPQYINSVALDWSGKVDYSQGFKQVSNLNLPKSYLFTYKEDDDYLNKYYKDRFNQVYGSFTFDDTYGLVEQKKVELVFSPLVITSPTGTDRKYPVLYKIDGNEVKKSKTNIRLGFYNGLKSCSDYYIKSYSGTSISTNYSGNTYPEISNYFITGNTIINNIHFGNPSETYFGITTGYTNATTSYYNYFVNQVSDLTDPDVKYFECSMLLTPIDISNLDLRIPIYIDTGRFGAGYFKIIKIEYDGKDKTSKVNLQKISL